MRTQYEGLSFYLYPLSLPSADVTTQQCSSGDKGEVATPCPALAHTPSGTPGFQPQRAESDRSAGRRSVCCSPADTRDCEVFPWAEDCAASTRDCRMCFWAFCRP